MGVGLGERRPEVAQSSARRRRVVAVHTRQHPGARPRRRRVRPAAVSPRPVARVSSARRARPARAQRHVSRAAPPPARLGVSPRDRGDVGVARAVRVPLLRHGVVPRRT